MPISHLMLALLVVTVWGCNFIFIKFSLLEIPPLLLCTLRFILASLPLIFFIKYPKGYFKMVALYGLLVFALQFSLLFWGMAVGMPPGLASLLLQIQVFFSILFAVIFLGETPSRWQVIGALVSFSGILFVAMHLDHTVSFAGFILILGAAAAWGTGNFITKKIGPVSMVALIAWGSFAASFPLLLLSLLIEGSTQIVNSLSHLSWLGVFSVCYIVYASTWVGYGVWNMLLHRYPVAMVAPFTLLVPVIGMMSSVLVLDEPLQSWKMTGGILVIAGLCINLLGARFSSRYRVLE